MTLQELFTIATEKNASDIHILPGYNPSIRINGELYPLKTYPVLTPEMTAQLLLPILDVYKRQVWTLYLLIS